MEPIVNETADPIGKVAKENINTIFNNMAERLVSEDAIVIMPTFYPQEGIILQELAKLGVPTHIYAPGGQIFKEVPHTTVTNVASNVDSETPENIQKIIDSINLEELRNRKIYIYQFMHYEWRNLLQIRIDEYNKKNQGKELNCKIMADMTMGHEQFFEGKHRLPGILEEAQLAQYKIPGTIDDLLHLRDNPLNKSSIKELFGIQPSDQTGKIVVQFCGEGYQEVGGGQGTIIFDNYEEFEQSLRLFKTPNTIEEAALTQDSKVNKFLATARANGRDGVSLKVSKFIDGIEGNLSFVVLPSYTQEGELVDIRKKVFTPSKVQINEQMQGLNYKRTVVVPGRMTLKCVGDKRLTTKSGSGVGNDLGYAYDQETNDQITQISTKLGKHMASLGHRGLAGCDIKITTHGQIYIIEINDRQQGPTAGMSQDAEEKGAPSLIKMQTIYSFGALEEIIEMQNVIEEKEKTIADIYMSQGGSFYIKFANTDEGATSKISLSPGYYALKKGQDSKWHFDLQNPILEYEAKLMQQNNLESGTVVLSLKGCNFKNGKLFGLDEQMAKIAGRSTDQFPGPFSPNTEKTKVQLQDGFWIQVISDLRNQIEHGHYVEKTSTSPTSIQNFEKPGKPLVGISLTIGNSYEARSSIIATVSSRTEEEQNIVGGVFVEQLAIVRQQNNTSRTIQIIQ